MGYRGAWSTWARGHNGYRGMGYRGLYPIAHVTHCQCGPYPLYPIPPVPLLPMCPTPLYPIPPVSPLPIGPWPIPPVPHVHYCPIWVMGQWGTEGMGHRGYRPMGDLDIFAHSIIITGWILTKILLYIDIDVFYLNTGRFFHDGLN